ncbi:MAG TPA: type VI secretion system baseplate subunit TssF [Chitinispirillaceae bacterium]|nr:type VI secretion system baseplate subunit TssF [Chitinispirillaceae bacterium]
MHEDLYPYYERELQYLRHSADAFSKKYPDSATALRIEPDRSHDPHVERLLEGCAFLAGRIRRKLDDEFPEIAESVLNMLFPHYLLPTPSMGIVQFQVDPQAAKLTSSYRIPKGTILQSAPVRGEPCRFRTCYPVDLAPVAIDDVRCDKWTSGVGPEPGCTWRAQAVLTISLKALSGLTFGSFSLPVIRLFLRGAPLSYRLYELLGRRVVRMEVLPTDTTPGSNNSNYGSNKSSRSVFLPADAIQTAGFGNDEELMPFPENAFPGYRLLREYFVLPEKFLFYDIRLNNTIERFAPAKNITLKIYLESMPENPSSIHKDLFALGCTPVVNLFPKRAEPQKTRSGYHEYRIICENGKPEHFEVYTVDKVEATDLSSGNRRVVEPFHSFRHALQPEVPFYWFSRREKTTDLVSARSREFTTESERAEDTSRHTADDTFLELCTLDYTRVTPANQSLSITLTCTNRNMVKEMPLADDGRTDFTALDSPYFGPVKVITLQRDPIRTPLGREDEYWTGSDSSRQWRGAYWRLISHLSLNYLSLKTGGIKALKALLQLYDVKGEAKSENIILGLTGLEVRPVNRLIKGALCQGLGIELTINPEQFKESSFYLFSAVLDRFFAQYVSINSFSQLTVVDNTERKNRLKQWPIRLGEQITI